MRAALRIFAAICTLLAAQPAAAELDLKRAEVSRLPNGLTVILLEDHSLPMVSAQMLYKSGSRDETAGKTGLAHFLEHLAFRASAQLSPTPQPPRRSTTPAASGTATPGSTRPLIIRACPTGGLDLLLRIEADRMAERHHRPGRRSRPRKAPSSPRCTAMRTTPRQRLLDAVTAAAFVSHPYRNNTIGLESDVAALTLEDAKAFYDIHYSPANAVLAIAGDFAPAQAKALIQSHFGKVAARPEPQRTKAVEPPQRGTRRVDLLGPVDRQHFEIAWPAPAASSPDFPAFLVLQQLLSGGSGVNFRQNDWGTPSEKGSLLHGATEDLRTWFIPTADRYVFTIKGSIASGARAGSSWSRNSANASHPPAPTRRPAASDSMLQKPRSPRQLAADVESTEDAAHQLAFFEGSRRLRHAASDLPERVAAVTPGQVQRVAQVLSRARSSERSAGIGPGQPPVAKGLGAGRAAAGGRARGRSTANSITHPAPELAPTLRRLTGSPPGQPRLTGGHCQVASSPGRSATKRRPRDLPGLGIVTRSGPAR